MSDVPARCPVCRSLIDEEELFCSNCGTEAPRRDDSGAAPARDSSRLATHNFECAGCGASMSYDASAGALRCPFCGSVDMKQQADARVLAPNRVVPFKVAHAQARQIMRAWLGRGWFRPGDLARRAAVIHMQPVYVPYWVFQARTHTYWTADTSQTPPGARADWYPLAGEHHGTYAGLLIGASSVLAPAETAAICPFDLAAGVAPEEVDLENVTVERFSLPRKYARPLARAALEQVEAERCARQYVPGRARNVHVSLLVEGMSSEPMLLPVWIMAYRYNSRVWRVLINGQTGKITGTAPISWARVALLVLLILAGVLAVLLCMGVLGLAAGAAGLGWLGDWEAKPADGSAEEDFLHGPARWLASGAKMGKLGSKPG